MRSFSSTKPNYQPLLALLIQHGTLYGSQLFGGSTSKSDYDYIVTPRAFQQIQAYCKTSDIPLKVKAIYNDSLGCDGHIEFIINKITYDIIYFAQPIDYENFLTAIDVCTAYSTAHSLHNKLERYKVFGALVNGTRYRPCGFKLPELTTFVNIHYPELLL